MANIQDALFVVHRGGSYTTAWKEYYPRLTMQSEILELTAKEKEKLRQIADMSRSAMSGMRDTVWAIDSPEAGYEIILKFPSF